MGTKKAKIRNNKSQLVIVGFLIIILGISIVFIDYYTNKKDKDIEEKSLELFYQEEISDDIIIDEETKEIIEEPAEKTTKEQNKAIIDYVAVIKIPKINLEKGLVDKNSYLNNVNKNIEILKESSMPNEENGNFILASHSGNGKTAYFKNLDKLEYGDNIYVQYNQLQYEYKIVNSYYIEKTGTANIVRNINKKSITLITCVPNKNEQLVVIGELVN